MGLRKQNSTIFIYFIFCGEWGGTSGEEGWKADVEDLRNEWDWGIWCEIPKEPIKNEKFYCPSILKNEVHSDQTGQLLLIVIIREISSSCL